MTVQTEQLLKDVLALPAAERAALADELLLSLERPDPEIEALWIKEIERRRKAYDAGEMESYSAEEVFAELDDL